MSARRRQIDGLTLKQYAALAAFRYELRRFLAFSEAAATEAGLPPQQHQALLVIAGHMDTEPPSVGTLAERLLIAPNTAAELVMRMVEADLLTKAPSPVDGRRLELQLTRRAATVLEQLTTAHLNELKTVAPSLTRELKRLRMVPLSDPQL